MLPSKRDQTEGQTARTTANVGKSRGSNGSDFSLRARQMTASSTMEMQNEIKAAIGDINAIIANALTSPIPKPEHPDTRRQMNSNNMSALKRTMPQKTCAKKVCAGYSERARTTATSAMKAARLLGSLHERASITTAAAMDAANTPAKPKITIPRAPSMAPPSRHAHAEFKCIVTQIKSAYNSRVSIQTKHRERGKAP